MARNEEVYLEIRLTAEKYRPRGSCYREPITKLYGGLNGMSEPNEYKIELYYGFVEGECGVWHAFEVCDPDSQPNDDAIAQNLADTLEVSPDSCSFTFNSMYLDLPESIVRRIRTDAIKEYMKKCSLSE